MQSVSVSFHSLFVYNDEKPHIFQMITVAFRCDTLHTDYAESIKSMHMADFCLVRLFAHDCSNPHSLTHTAIPNPSHGQSWQIWKMEWFRHVKCKNVETLICVSPFSICFNMHFAIPTSRLSYYKCPHFAPFSSSIALFAIGKNKH